MSINAQTLFIPRPGTVELREVTLPDPAPGEVLVKGAYIALCGGETERFTGAAPTSYPSSIGHELSGLVAKVGPGVTTLKPGDPVAAWPGTTDSPTADPIACGGTYWIAREPYCVPGHHVSLKALACAEPTMCSHLAVVAPACGRGGLEIDQDVVVIGAGFMGLAAVASAALRGPRTLIALARRPEARQLAKEHGATDAFDFEDPELLEYIRAATGGRMPSVVYEVTGVQAGVTLAESLIDWEARLAVPGDQVYKTPRIVTVGYHQTDGGNRIVAEEPLDVAGCPTMRGHFRYPTQIMSGMRSAVQLMRTGMIDPVPFTGSTFDIGDAQAALEYASSRADFRKVVIACNPGEVV
jgi:threonine dehydrogenase-like Zn-dependent dehydrogenase